MATNPFQNERDALAEEGRKLRLEKRDLLRQIKNLQKEEDTAAFLRKSIFNLSERVPDPPAWIDSPRKSAGKLLSVPVAFFSDWHLGERVFKDQVGGMNEFSMAIARKRIKRLVEVIIDLAKNHMGKMAYPGIVVPLGGDMISGSIHEELRETNEGTVQQTLLFAQDELTAAITKLADEFGRVFCPCVVGNHGRAKMKPHAKNRAFENYEWTLYHQLMRHFRNDPRVRFFIPDGPDAPFTVLGHRFMLTHGDSLGVKGGDGIIGAIGPIARGTMKIGRSQAAIGEDFDTLMIGHWHTYTPRGEAAPVIVNGTLKGFDEFAHTLLRVPYSRPSQALFFVHAEHGITAQWQVFLDGKRKAAHADDWLRFDQSGGSNG